MDTNFYNELTNTEDKEVVVTIAYQKNGSGDYGYHTEPLDEYTQDELIELCDEYEYDVREVEEMIDIIIDVGMDDI